MSVVLASIIFEPTKDTAVKPATLSGWEPTTLNFTRFLKWSVHSWVDSSALLNSNYFTLNYSHWYRIFHS